MSEESSEKKSGILRRAAEKQIGEEVRITWVGTTRYGTELTGETIPARIVGGRTEKLRFSAVLSDEPPLDPQWKIGESRVVKLLITHDRDLQPKDNAALFEWSLGAKQVPRNHQVKLLVDFITSEAFLAAIQVQERIQNYKPVQQEVPIAVREANQPYSSEPKHETTTRAVEPGQADNPEVRVKEHWEAAFTRLDELETAHQASETRTEPDAVDRLRAELDERLGQILDGHARQSRSHDIEH